MRRCGIQFSFFFALVLALTLAMPGCATGPLRPTVTEYLATETGLFTLDLRSGQARCKMSYRVRNPIGSALVLRIEFENSQHPEEPFFVERLLKAGQDLVAFESPPLVGLQDGVVYRTVLRGYRADNGELVFEHPQKLRFIGPPGLPDP